MLCGPIPLLGTYNTTALVYDDIYYTLLDRGFLLAHDAATGEEIYGRRRLEIGNGFTASPWAYNGKVFLLSEDGDTFVVKAGREFKILHKNSLNEMSLATPAVARRSIILRTQSKLYRIARSGGDCPLGARVSAHQRSVHPVSRRRSVMMTKQQLAAAVVGMLLLAGPPAAGQASVLDSSAARGFMGTWVISMESPKRRHIRPDGVHLG